MSELIDEIIDHFTKLKTITTDTVECIGEANDQLLVYKMKEITKYNSYIQLLLKMKNK